LDMAARARAADRPELAVRLAEVAMTALPRQGNDLEAGHRYAAACAAALAGTGGGNDDPAPEEQAKTELRQLAFNWLRADLALLAKQLENASPAARDSARQKLKDWQQAQDLAGIRDEAALGKLSETERAIFTKLWAYVESLLQIADQP